MASSLFVGLLAALAVLLGLTAAASAECPRNFTFIDGGCFMLVKEPMEVTHAAAYCRFYYSGGTLATVRDKDQWKALVEYINKEAPGRYWSAGVSDRGVPTWNTDRAELNEPINSDLARLSNYRDNTCFYICSVFNQTLYSGDCSTKRGFICQA